MKVNWEWSRWFADDRLGVGLDFECPGIALIFHRCHGFVYMQGVCLWVNIHYGKSIKDEEET